jgi:hypothetical protein
MPTGGQLAVSDVMAHARETRSRENPRTIAFAVLVTLQFHADTVGPDSAPCSIC